ncbi:MAG: cytochrome P450 [Novosphingobium sp.]
MLRQGIGDVGSVIPDSILNDFAVQLPGGGAPLVVSSPALAREVLNDRADQFDRDRLIRRLFRRSWGKGLAAAEGADWQRQRRATVPFFRPQTVQAQLAAFAQAADSVIAGLEPGQHIELTDLAGRIVARIALSVLVDGRGLVDPDAAARDVPAYLRRISDFALADLLPLPESLIDRMRGIDGDPAVRRLRAMGSTLAAARRDGVPRADMIALLEGNGPIEDNIRGLFPAAMDTTVNGLAWALYALARHPQWQDRVAAEGAQRTLGSTLEGLGVTRQVVSETLRLYPPGPLLARCAARDMELAGHRVRKGQTVIVAVYALHRHRQLWHQPDLFEPDRFLPGRAQSDAYMPFGTGPRMCIAAHFAQAEMAVILSRIAARFRIEPDGPDPEVSLKVSTCARSGLGARLIARQAA